MNQLILREQLKKRKEYRAMYNYSNNLHGNSKKQYNEYINYIVDDCLENCKDEEYYEIEACEIIEYTFKDEYIRVDQGYLIYENQIIRKLF